MIYRDMPGTELNVSSVCMGGGPICVENDMEYCESLLDKYIDLGGNFIDTANIYGKWLPGGENSSERNIGAWMKERGNRHQLIIATKGGHPHLASMNIPRLSREEVAADLDESLRTLQTDYVDLYWLHRDDESLPAAYILEYLNDFVKEGKIRYFGCSNWKVERILEAARYEVRKGIKGFIGNQMMWNLAHPNKEAIGDKTMVCMDGKAMRLHNETNLAAVPYSSQANGFFDKLERQGAEALAEGVRKLYYNGENLKRYERVKKLAQELSRSVTEIVLGYLTSQPFTTIPIVGSRTVEQLEDSMSAGDLVLDGAMLRFLEGMKELF